MHKFTSPASHPTSTPDANLRSLSDKQLLKWIHLFVKNTSVPWGVDSALLMAVSLAASRCQMFVKWKINEWTSKLGGKGGNHGNQQKRKHLFLRKVLALYVEEIGAEWLDFMTVGYTQFPSSTVKNSSFTRTYFDFKCLNVSWQVYGINFLLLGVWFLYVFSSDDKSTC